MIIIFVRKLNYGAMTLFPFIFIRKDIPPERLSVLINHERIHIRQQLELLIFIFYLLYLLNYLINLIRYRNHDKAYREIIFEKEAFRHERELTYLNRRKLFQFLKEWH